MVYHAQSERKRETNRHIEKVGCWRFMPNQNETDREIDRQTDRQREKERERLFCWCFMPNQRERERKRERQRDKERQTDRQTEKQRNRQTDGQRERARLRMKETDTEKKRKGKKEKLADMATVNARRLSSKPLTPFSWGHWMCNSSGRGWRGHSWAACQGRGYPP